MKCEKCKQKEGIECVYYSEHEGYLCKSCYRKWLDIAQRISEKYKDDYTLFEKKYLEWIKEK